MANEAVTIELGGSTKGGVMRFATANGTGIEKGTLLQFEDARTVSSVYVANAPFAGIAAEEKVAGDGATSIGLYTCGVFDILAGSAIVCGAPVSISGGNAVKQTTLTSDILSGMIVGKALETATNGETIAVAVGVY